jgi:hypothetical protein
MKIKDTISETLNDNTGEARVNGHGACRFYNENDVETIVSSIEGNVLKEVYNVLERICNASPVESCFEVAWEEKEKIKRYLMSEQYNNPDDDNKK